MPEKISKTTDEKAPATITTTTTTTTAKPSPTPRTIVAEEHGSDGSYTIWYSDGSVESGQGGG